MQRPLQRCVVVLHEEKEMMTEIFAVDGSKQQYMEQLQLALDHEREVLTRLKIKDVALQQRLALGRKRRRAFTRALIGGSLLNLGVIVAAFWVTVVEVAFMPWICLSTIVASCLWCVICALRRYSPQTQQWLERQQQGVTDSRIREVEHINNISCILCKIKNDLSLAKGENHAHANICGPSFSSIIPRSQRGHS